MVDWSWPDGWLNDPEMSMLVEWFAAAKSGDIKKVAELLDSGVDIDAGDRIDATALMYAVGSGHHDLIRLLIARGANLDSSNTMRGTALSAAIGRARLTAETGRPWDPIPLQILQEAGARYRLYDAVLIDDISLARQRLEEGAEPDFAEGTYHGPVLMIAARKGQLGMVDLLLDHGANIEAMDDLGNRPLLEAAYNGHTEVVRLLLKRGAELDAGNWSGQSALSESALGGHRELYDFLRSMGAERGIVDALVMDDRDLFTALLDSKIGDKETEVDWFSDGRQSLSMLAVERGNLHIFRHLLDRGASTSPRREDRTLLAQAAKHGQVEIACLLIERGAHVHATGRDGLTPLAWAIQTGHDAVAAVLREAGATR